MPKIKKSATPWQLATLMLCLAVLTSCAPQPAPAVYLLGSSRTVPLNAGDPAPFSGWLLTNEAMADLLAGP